MQAYFNEQIFNTRRIHSDYSHYSLEKFPPLLKISFLKIQAAKRKDEIGSWKICSTEEAVHKWGLPSVHESGRWKLEIVQLQY